jgi:hypothetical protein
MVPQPAERGDADIASAEELYRAGHARLARELPIVRSSDREAKSAQQLS